MKSLLIGLFLIPTLCFCQQKKDSKVIVSVSDTSNLFNRITLALYEKGYTLDTKDESVGFIKTKEKEMEDYFAYQSMTVFIKQGVITLTSKIRLGGVGTFDVEYMGERKNAFTASWNEVVSFGKQFGTVSFSR
jgi:hypothetical protein